MNKETKDENEKHYIGHRERLRKKILEQGEEALADYELLELILTMSIPRRDVKPLAKNLLQKFGGFAELMSASVKEIMEVDGIKENSAAAIKAVNSAAIKMLAEKISKNPIIDCWDKLENYCRASMACIKNEQFRIFFLDIKNRLISDELQQKGTVNHTPVYPREVVKRALELGAVSIIMVHNHPSGDSEPSKADIEVTKSVKNAIGTVGISLIDHLIITRNDCFSFRNNGLIR